jgi:lysophospholipid acyltransferase 7
MLVSAYWHGVHAGYHLSMLTTVPCMVAEDLLAAAFHDNRPPHHQRAFTWLVWFIRCRSFDYMSMGFMLLSLSATHRYWASVYYAGHVWTAALIAIGYCCRPLSMHTKQPHAGDKQQGEAAPEKSAGDKKVQ